MGAGEVGGTGGCFKFVTEICIQSVATRSTLRVSRGPIVIGNLNLRKEWGAMRKRLPRSVRVAHAKWDGNWVLNRKGREKKDSQRFNRIWEIAKG